MARPRHEIGHQSLCSMFRFITLISNSVFPRCLLVSYFNRPAFLTSQRSPMFPFRVMKNPRQFLLQLFRILFLSHASASSANMSSRSSSPYDHDYDHVTFKGADSGYSSGSASNVDMPQT